MCFKALAFVAAGLVLSTPALAQDGLSDYPLTLNGKRRVVLNLPAVAGYDNLAIQIRPGKNIESRDCNGKFLSAKLSVKTLPNSDYKTYVDIESDGGVGSTMMYCPQPAETITVYGPRLLVDYPYSRPVVVYVPDSIVVQYRIMRPDTPFKPAESEASAGKTGNLTCEYFSEKCRATFCTGGFQLKKGSEVLETFRFFDFQNEARAKCEEAKQKASN